MKWNRSWREFMNDNNIEALRIIVREVIKELHEATMTGNVAGYNTPNAFSSDDDKKKKKKRLVPKGHSIVDDLEEAVELAENRWLELKKDDTRNNNRKIADGTSHIRKKLIEIKKYLRWYSKIRNENDIKKDNFHVRTTNNIKKISKLVDEIRKQLKEFQI